MKLCSVFALLHFGIITTVYAQNASFVAAQIEQISPCGLGCLTHTIPAAGCSLTNTTCQCSSTRLVQTTAVCMMANCTLAETLELSKIQAAICERPHESQNKKLRIMTIVCAVFTNTAALLRFATRLSSKQTFGCDDLFMAGAVVTDAVFASFGVKLEEHGFGEHVWDIKLDSVPQLFYWFYICEMLYVMTIGFIKVSLLFFYLRVFPKKSLRIACWATMAFCAATTVAFTLVTIFQCHPIIYVWNKDVKGGRCVNYNSAAWANAGINIVQDIIIILLPMNELRHLQLNRKKKIGMYAMFGVGSFVCVTSMVRLESLRSFGLTPDPTWDNVPTTFWSTLETSTAIFCACMPAIRAGFIRIFPRIQGATTHLASTSFKSSSRDPEDESVPSRIVEEERHDKLISLLPLNIRSKAKPILKIEERAATEKSARHDAIKQDIVSNKSCEVGLAAAADPWNKPLPLTPIWQLSRPASLPTSTSDKEMSDAEEDTTGDSSSTDTSGLV